MHMPKVSVILPCYNGEKYLNQCIDSILNQTLRDLELICVDDGSTDGTLRILEAYRARDSRVQVLTQPNGGAGAARNNGMRQATGEFLSFLDADDFFEPDMLESALQAAEAYRADYVVFGADRYEMETSSFVQVPWTILREDIPTYMPFSYRELTGNVFLSFVGWAWDKLYRRSFVESQNLLFQEQRTTNDMLFVFSGLVTAERIAVVDRVLAHQRRGIEDSLSVTREKSWHCFYDALTALRQRLLNEGIFWELEQDFINYALHFSLWHLNSLAEPTHTKLEEKLRTEWFRELGITEKPESYFWSREEYAQYKKICKGMKCAAASEQQLLTGGEKCLPEVYTSLVRLCEESPDGTDPYKINVTFDRIRDELMESPTEWRKYQFVYWREKLACYEKILPLLPPEHREDFLMRMRREFRRAERLGQLDRTVFSGEQWKRVRNLIRHADGAVSMLQSVSLFRRLSGFVPAPVKRFLISLLHHKS